MKLTTTARGAMKRWRETGEILDRLTLWKAEGKRAALATVIGVSGSAYRREGAKIVVAEEGSSCGNVSGGCLEEDVREVALRVIRSGRSELRSYCTGAGEVEAWDLGIGCEGVVEIFVAPCGEALPLERDLLDGEEPFGVVTLLEEEGTPPRMVVTSSGTIEGGLGDPALTAAAAAHAIDAMGEGFPRRVDLLGRSIFFDLFTPPPRLLIVGAGEDAPPLADLALRLGFRVEVSDRRPGRLDPELFPVGVHLHHARPVELVELLALDADSWVVVMTHSFADDFAALRALLGTSAGYIGVLGPRHRTERLLAGLPAERLTEVNRVQGPVGLDLGGEGAEVVALSILAEILTLRSRREGLPSRERLDSLHASAK